MSWLQQTCAEEVHGKASEDLQPPAPKPEAPNHTCEQCGKQLSSKRNLASHIKTHDKVKVETRNDWGYYHVKEDCITEIVNFKRHIWKNYSQDYELCYRHKFLCQNAKIFVIKETLLSLSW